MALCTAPYCAREAKFAEPSENGQFEVCKKHCDPTKDGVERL